MATAIIAGTGNQLTRLKPAHKDAAITAISERQGCFAETNSRGRTTITSRW